MSLKLSKSLTSGKNILLLSFVFYFLHLKGIHLRTVGIQRGGVGSRTPTWGPGISLGTQIEWCIEDQDSRSDPVIERHPTTRNPDPLTVLIPFPDLHSSHDLLAVTTG